MSWYRLVKMVEKSTAQKDRVTGEKDSDRAGTWDLCSVVEFQPRAFSPS